MTDPAQLWDAVKGHLQTTVPNKRTYDTILLTTRLLSVDNGVYVIETTEANREWLEKRLHDTVRRAVAHVTGQPDIQLTFVAPEQAPSPSQGEGWGEGLDWTTVSAELLDFNPYGTGGYFAMSNYIQEFWGAYLGAGALQILNYVRRFYDEPAIIKQGKATVINPNWSAWTTPKSFHLSELVRAIKGTDKQVRGCWRTCHRYNQELAQGIARDTCFCGLHAGELALGKPLLPDYPDGKPICHFWRAGLLDLLQIEEILTVQPQGDPLKPATVMFRIQAFQPLPLLTPWQVARLSTSIQDRHRKWLSGHNVNLAAWGAIPVERLMPLVKLYPKWLRS